ncbi:MAG: 4Fe-4S dicluster domain-containing protein [Bacillota bacterium]
MNDLREELYRLPGGEKFNLCIQCGTCSASCPSVSAMRYSPRQVIALVRAGMVQEVLHSNAVWMCASCYMCTVRCPRDIQPTELMHTLQLLAARLGLIADRSPAPAFYRAFRASVKAHGRAHEFGIMFNFLLGRPGKALRMLPVAISLFRRGRLSLRVPRTRGASELATILSALRQGGESETPAALTVAQGGVSA